MGSVSTSVPGRAMPASAIRRRHVALAMAACATWLAARYPILPALALVLWAAWAAACFRFPTLWIGVVPAVMPAVGFAPWTGWLVFEELDLLLAGAVAAGYARIALGRDEGDANGSAQGQEVDASGARVPLVSVLLLAALPGDRHDCPGAWRAGCRGARSQPDPGLLRCAQQCAAVQGLCLGAVAIATPAQGRACRAGALDRATSPGVSPRGWPSSRSAPCGNVPRSPTFSISRPTIGPPVSSGRCTSAARRSTAIWRCRFRSRCGSRGMRAAAGPTGPRSAVVLLASYAALTTFSRGVFAALPAGVLVWAVMRFRQRPGAGVGMGFRNALAAAAFVAVSCLVAWAVFQHGGYRGLVATLMAFAAVVIVLPAMRSLPASILTLALLSGLLVALLMWALGLLTPKGPYVLHALLFGICVPVAFVSGQTPERGRAFASGRDGVRAGVLGDQRELALGRYDQRRVARRRRRCRGARRRSGRRGPAVGGACRAAGPLRLVAAVAMLGRPS